MELHTEPQEAVQRLDFCSSLRYSQGQVWPGVLFLSPLKESIVILGSGAPVDERKADHISDFTVSLHKQKMPFQYPTILDLH